MMAEYVREKFKTLFSRDPILIASPGRVNLIGEHTDYNDGYVLPAAIDKQILFALAANGLNKIRLHADAFNQTLEFSLESLTTTGNWADYLLGVVALLKQQSHQVHGFDCVIGGDIPIGAGLSSSAALECGMAFGLDHIFGFGLSRLEMAKIGQQAEHIWVGVQCGIMDQFASLLGKKDQLISLDCRSLEFSYIPFDFPNHRILLCNTMVDHSLASSQYNERRKQCEEGVEILRREIPSIQSLRDIKRQELYQLEDKFPPLIFQRCSYVVEENERVLKGGDLLHMGDLDGFGQLMFASHQGLRDKYEVSCKELDFITEMARNRTEVSGARMMGGGFGGCVIHIIHKDGIAGYTQFITEAYERKFSKIPEIYTTSIESGTHLIG
jgi:galactokinase